MVDAEYRTLLVINNSTEYTITVYIWDKICCFFGQSKIISPGDKYPYRRKKKFKYEAVATGPNLRKKTIISTRECTDDTVLIIDNNLSVNESNLEDHPQDKRICIRRLNMKEETNIDCIRDFYRLLNIDRKSLNGKSEDEKRRLIRSKYREAARMWHPDHNPVSGDSEIFNDVHNAYSILIDPEERADYNNLLDYDSGILTKLKSIFWSECCTPKQKNNYWKRLGCSVLSCLFAAGGIALLVCTAGLAAPIVIPSSCLGSGLVMAGIRGGIRTMTRESVEKGLDMKKYIKSTGIGLIAGAAIGGAGIGVVAGFVGLGAAALPSAQLGMAGYVASGTTVGAISGVVCPLADSADLALVDGVSLSARQILGRTAVGGVGGALAGCAGGAVSVAMADDLVGATVGRRVFRTTCKKIVKAVTENVTGNLIESNAQFVEERLDDSVENQSFSKHAEDSLKKVSLNAGTAAVSILATAAAKCAVGEFPEQTGTDISRLEDHQPDLLSGSSPLEIRSTPTGVAGLLYNSARVVDQGGCVKYISKGRWFSRMVVRYWNSDGDEVRTERQGSGGSIDIPHDATDIKVSFFVGRGVWCELKQFYRRSNTWHEPTRAHVFRYNSPPQRTFTIGGKLYYEKVVKVTDANYDSVDDI